MYSWLHVCKVNFIQDGLQVPLPLMTTITKYSHQSLNFSRPVVKAGQSHPFFADKFFSWITINFGILKMRFSWVLCFADIREPKPEVSVLHLDATLPFLYEKYSCKDGPTAAGFRLSHSKALSVWISCFLSGSTERNSTRKSCVKQEWWRNRKKNFWS